MTDGNENRLLANHLLKALAQLGWGVNSRLSSLI